MGIKIGQAPSAYGLGWAGLGTSLSQASHLLPDEADDTSEAQAVNCCLSSPWPRLPGPLPGSTRIVDTILPLNVYSSSL